MWCCYVSLMSQVLHVISFIKWDVIVTCSCPWPFLCPIISNFTRGEHQGYTLHIPGHLVKRLNQWLFLVPAKGGRWHRIPQLSVYTTYIPLIYCLLGCYMLPTTFYGNQKQPLIKNWCHVSHACFKQFKHVQTTFPYVGRLIGLQPLFRKWLWVTRKKHLSKSICSWVKGTSTFFSWESKCPHSPNVITFPPKKGLIY